MKPTGESNYKKHNKRERSGPLGQVLLSFIVLFAFSIPVSAFASIDITEIMYDAPGSDAGHEWIEVTNSGTAPVDLYGYKLSEGGANHAMSAAEGTSTLAVGEVAIISNNIQSFLSDFPNYSGTILKSSFSLSNTGEEVVVKDTKLAAVAPATYNSNSGAGGDGNSLHNNNGAWKPGAPNPGSTAVTSEIVKAPTAKKSSSASTKKSKTSSLSFGSDSSQSAAVGASDVFQTPSLSGNDTLWTTIFGLAALIVVGIAGVLYVKRPGEMTLTQIEKTPTAEEFKIN